MAARRKCCVSKENSSFFYAQQALPEDTGELNPPVCRERMLCQGIQVHFKSYNIFIPNIPFGNGQSATGFIAAPWTHNFNAGWDLGVLLAEDGKQRKKKSSQNQRGLQIQPQKMRGFQNPPQKQSGLKGRRMGRKRKKSKRVYGTQLTPDLRSRDRSEPPVGIQLWRLWARFPKGQFSFF